MFKILQRKNKKKKKNIKKKKKNLKKFLIEKKKKKKKKKKIFLIFRVSRLRIYCSIKTMQENMQVSEPNLSLEAMIEDEREHQNTQKWCIYYMYHDRRLLDIEIQRDTDRQIEKEVKKFLRTHIQYYRVNTYVEATNILVFKRRLICEFTFRIKDGNNPITEEKGVSYIFLRHRRADRY